MFEFLKKNQEEVSLLIHIGNGSIAGSFVLFDGKNLPRFLYTERAQLSISERPDDEKKYESAFSLLDKLLQSLIVRGFALPYWNGRKKRLAHVMIAFSAPWYTLKTKHISLTKDKTFIVSKSFVQDIINKEEKKFKEELSQDNSDATATAFEVIEKSIVHTKINGYVMKDSIGKKTKIFDTFLAMSAISENFIEGIYSVILKNTHIPREKIISETSAMVEFSVVRDFFPNFQNFLLVDICGEESSFIVVTDDVISGVTSMPSGRNFIVREIAKEFGVSLEIAESTLHVYTSKKMGESEVLRMANVIENVEKEWAIYFESVFADLSKSFTIAPRAYLSADSDVRGLFVDFLKLPKTDATAVFRKNLDLISLDEGILKTSYKNESLTLVDEQVILLALFYNKILQQQ